jgi:hypothetical protein
VAPENFAGAVLINPAVDHARHALNGNLHQGLGMAHAQAPAFAQSYGRAPFFDFLAKHAKDPVGTGGDAAGAHAHTDEVAVMPAL